MFKHTDAIYYLKLLLVPKVASWEIQRDWVNDTSALLSVNFVLI